MVCLPCFIIPVLLYIWHKFIQPIVLRYWNPWEKKDAKGNVIKAGPEFPFECKGGVCPYVKKPVDAGQQSGDEAAAKALPVAATIDETKGNVIKAGTEFPSEYNEGAYPYVKKPLDAGQQSGDEAEAKAPPIATFVETTLKKEN